MSNNVLELTEFQHNHFTNLSIPNKALGLFKKICSYGIGEVDIMKDEIKQEIGVVDIETETLLDDIEGSYQDHIDTLIVEEQTGDGDGNFTLSLSYLDVALMLYDVEMYIEQSEEYIECGVEDEDEKYYLNPAKQLLEQLRKITEKERSKLDVIMKKYKIDIIPR